MDGGNSVPIGEERRCCRRTQACYELLQEPAIRENTYMAGGRERCDSSVTSAFQGAERPAAHHETSMGITGSGSARIE